MPPKKQITAEYIVEKAFDLVTKEGYETLTARKLAKELKCSTQPIYHAFADMNELKVELIKKALDKMMKYIMEHNDKTLPVDLSNILAYVRFAREEKYLFQLIFTSGSLNHENIDALLPKDNDVDLNMVIYVNGIVMMSAYNTIAGSEEVVRDMIIHAYYLFKK